MAEQFNKAEKIEEIRTILIGLKGEIENARKTVQEPGPKDIRFLQANFREMIDRFHDLTLEIIEDFLKFIDNNADELNEATINLILRRKIGSSTLNFYDHIITPDEQVPPYEYSLQSNDQLRSRVLTIASDYFNSVSANQVVNVPNINWDRLLTMATERYATEEEETLLGERYRKICSELGLDDFIAVSDILADFFKGTKNIVSDVTNTSAHDLYMNILAKFSFLFGMLPYFMGN